MPFWELPTYIELADRAGLGAAGYRLQYQQLLARPFLLAAMVLLAASVSLRFFRFGGVQKMVLSGITAGFLLFVLSENHRGHEQAELMPPVAGGVDPGRGRRPDRIRRAAVPGGRLVASTRGPLRPGLRSSVRVGATALAALLRVRRRIDPPCPRRCSRQQARQSAAFPARGRRRRRKSRRRPPTRRCSCRRPRSDTTTPTIPVAAVGNVQIYYGGATIEADQVIYDQKTKRLRAQGNVRLTEADGKITYGQFIDLTDDYRDGFVDLLRLETARRYALCRGARRSRQGQLHGPAKRRLYRLRALQGRSEKAAAVAGPGRADHP